jgi:hypothetical protein
MEEQECDCKIDFSNLLGPLKKFSSDTLFSKHLEPEKEDERALMLVISSIYNDLHSLFVLHDIFLHDHVKATDSTSTVHNGEVAGLRVYVTKNLIGTLREAVKVLAQEKKLLESVLMRYQEDLTAKERNAWDFVLKEIGDTPLYLKKVRDGIAFHYDKRIFIGSFQDRSYQGDLSKDKKFDCYISNPCKPSDIQRGRDFVTSGRFYFTDALTESYMKEETDNVSPNNIFEIYVVPLAVATGFLCKKYFEQELRPSSVNSESGK